MLHARFLRSPYPHARIHAVDVRAAERSPGVRAVLVLLGPNGMGGAASVSAEENVEATRRGGGASALYAGAAVAAVAATSEDAAEAALRLIKVAYEPLPFVVDMDAARAAGAPVVYETLDVQSGPGATGRSPPPCR